MKAIQISILLLILMVSCKKEQVITPTEPVVTPPKPIVCDKYHYGDSCKYAYIDNYLGQYIMINSNMFIQKGSTTVILYNFDTNVVTLFKRGNRYYLKNIWGGGEEAEATSTDKKLGFSINSLPSYKNFNVRLTDVYFGKRGLDTFNYKGYQQTNESGFTFTSDVNIKLIRK